MELPFFEVAASAGIGLLLVAALLIGLILIPLGLPGLWVILGAAVVHSFVVPDSGIGVVTLVGCTLLVLLAELLEFSLAGRYARKYGGSKRASWGAIVGGFLGMFLGIPVPIVGPVVGAFVGAFGGAFLAELTVSPEVRGHPGRVGWGAVVGRAVAAAAKMAVGIAVSIWILMAA